MAEPAAIGLDVGGTKMLGAVVDADGTILQRRRDPTPDREQPLVDGMVELLADLRQRAGRAVPIGLGFPGLVTRDGTFRYGPNICLVEHPLREVLSARLEQPVLVDNDGNTATWAEFRVGAGAIAGVRGHMLLFSLGTGVGGGVIIDGRVLRGANGFAGEVGHLVVDIDGTAGPSGVRGEIEAYSSGTAIGRLAAQAHADGRFAGTPLDGPGPPSAAAVSGAAVDGVAAARDVIVTAGRHLGVAAAGLASVLDPELVVVGGGAASAGEVLLQPAREAFEAHLLGPAHRPPIPVVPAALGPDAGVIGAALLALEQPSPPGV